MMKDTVNTDELNEAVNETDSENNKLSECLNAESNEDADTDSDVKASGKADTDDGFDGDGEDGDDEDDIDDEDDEDEDNEDVDDEDGEDDEDDDGEDDIDDEETVEAPIRTRAAAPKHTRTGFIAIVGMPNVGKSTLLNRLSGEKIAAVSKKPQTTRTRITGIVTKGETQYVFLDTPGVLRPRNKLGDIMLKEIGTALADVCCVLFVTEPDGEITQTEREMLARFAKDKQKVILLINKIDACKKGLILTTIDVFVKTAKDIGLEFASVIPISAETGESTEIIFDELEPFIAEGEWYFSSDMFTDLPEKKIVEEIIREKLLRLLDEEVPHGTAVVVEDFRDIRGHLLSVRAEIFCEKSSHKGIIIGRNGVMLKKIGTYAREDMEAFFGVKVNLDLWVKVKENWRDDKNLLTSFGFNDGKD